MDATIHVFQRTHPKKKANPWTLMDPLRRVAESFAALRISPAGTAFARSAPRFPVLGNIALCLRLFAPLCSRFPRDFDASW
jgi:hypothetical protein